MSPLPAIPAIVPAAGESRRMGRPKLLVEFGGQALIGRVVSALRQGGCDPVIVIAPPPTSPEGEPVAHAASASGARVIAPATRPVEMRRSVEHGLTALEADGPPPAIVLTPADTPGLSSGVVAKVLSAWASQPEKIVVATVMRKHAHPLVLPWDLAKQIPALPPDRGANAILAAHGDRLLKLEIPHAGLAGEFNTPDDLDRWTARGAASLSVRLFAVAKERMGRSEIQVELALPATVAGLREAIARQHEALASLVPGVLIAVDSEYASDDALLGPGSKLALIPPVSGGSGL